MLLREICVVFFIFKVIQAQNVGKNEVKIYASRIENKIGEFDLLIHKINIKTEDFIKNARGVSNIAIDKIGQYLLDKIQSLENILKKTGLSLNTYEIKSFEDYVRSIKMADKSRCENSIHGIVFDILRKATIEVMEVRFEKLQEDVQNCRKSDEDDRKVVACLKQVEEKSIRLLSIFRLTFESIMSVDFMSYLSTHLKSCLTIDGAKLFVKKVTDIMNWRSKQELASDEICPSEEIANNFKKNVITSVETTIANIIAVM